MALPVIYLVCVTNAAPGGVCGELGNGQIFIRIHHYLQLRLAVERKVRNCKTQWWLAGVYDTHFERLLNLQEPVRVLIVVGFKPKRIKSLKTHFFRVRYNEGLIVLFENGLIESWAVIHEYFDNERAAADPNIFLNQGFFCPLVVELWIAQEVVFVDEYLRLSRRKLNLGTRIYELNDVRKRNGLCT